MSASDSELVQRLHRRARRVLLACLESLEQAPVSVLGAKLRLDVVHEALTVLVLRSVVFSMGRARGLFGAEQDFLNGRLFAPLDARLNVTLELQDRDPHWRFPPALAAAQGTFHAELQAGLASDGVNFGDCSVELLGNLYELLLGETVERLPGASFSLSSGKRRKQTGTFFTPRALTEVVVGRALELLDRRIKNSAHRAHDFVIDFRVCDPAVGGGAFLLEVARALATRLPSPSTMARRRAIALQVVHGIDLNPIAVAVAEAALCLFVGDPELPLQEAGKNLRVGDALVGAPYRLSLAGSSPKPSAASEFTLDLTREFAEVFERGGFDLVIGNPPWVAFAGRAAQPLPAVRKAYFAAHYSALKGYPTLHGLFVERATALAPQGTIALVVPSPIADLHGYRAVRRAVRSTHTPSEPMLEFGQDAFVSVTQPCFALIAEARTGNSPLPDAAEQPFRLAERQRAAGVAAEIAPPGVLLELAQGTAFPRELFGEMGFQTTSVVTQNLLRRTTSPDAQYHYPLLEGRDVHEFREGDPKLYLCPDAATLAQARCRLRDREDYRRVQFVVRQTARFPIAAVHRGLPFRNSLLAGFAVEGFPVDLIVGLLNSSLYRALHLALRRDARQAAFPQVKVGHLRALPEPPRDAALRAPVAALSAELTHSGFDSALVERLDAAVFGLFSLNSSAADEILEFLAARGARRN